MLQTATELINTFGFPIACTLAMFWYVNKKDETYSNDIKELRDAHHKEVAELKDAINNNTNVMLRLCDRLEVKENGI